MTHLPFIIASYGITFITLIILTVQSWLRLRKIKLKLSKMKYYDET
ncbi:hypothetical protein COMNV_01122 [Commensalibacter sp. Nvir]|nr:hypothetical protein COMNV_01122 [Commensalibacter sp. Nvir]